MGLHAHRLGLSYWYVLAIIWERPPDINECCRPQGHPPPPRSWYGIERVYYTHVRRRMLACVDSWWVSYVVAVMGKLSSLIFRPVALLIFNMSVNIRSAAWLCRQSNPVSSRRYCLAPATRFRLPTCSTSYVFSLPLPGVSEMVNEAEPIS